MGECQVILLCNVLKKIVQIGGHHKKNIQRPNSNRNSFIHILSYDNKVSERKTRPY